MARISSAMSVALVCVAVGFGAALLAGASLPHSTGPQELAVGGFIIEHEVVVSATPEEAFDAMTGDVSGWWDHHLSEKPVALTIDPRPGGGFSEIFDAEGDGALHATVNVAQRGKLLRFTGPLGLTGWPVELVNTLEFSPAEDGKTRVKLTCRAAGAM
ncbi:MAG: SRPBCC domain-containing protein, partial [Planctomycetota bacterium]